MAKLCPFRRANIYNVMDAPYSAHADGVTDDVAHIQAAIDAAYAAGGGTVYMPAGTYYLYAAHTVNVDCGAQLELKSNVRLVGAGSGLTTLRTTRNNASCIAASQQSNMRIGGFSVNMEFSSSGGVDALKIYACSRVKVYDIIADGNGYALSGISLTGCNDSTIEDCIAHDFTNIGITANCNAIGLNNPDGLWGYNVAVTDCETYAIGNHGFGAYGQDLLATYGGDSTTRRVDHVTFTRCNTHDNTGTGFLHTYASNVTMADCTAANSGGSYNHVDFRGVTTATITGMTLTGTKYWNYGILRETGTSEPYYTDATAFSHYGASSGITIMGTGY